MGHSWCHFANKVMVFSDCCTVAWWIMNIPSNPNHLQTIDLPYVHIKKKQHLTHVASPHYLSPWHTKIKTA